MIILSDQIFTTLPLPEDARLSNLVVSGNTIIVETKQQYLSRVDTLSRFLGQEVDFLSPSGIYPSNTFINNINTQVIVTNKYGFLEGIDDEYFEPIPCCSVGTGGGDSTQIGDNVFSGDNFFTGDNIHEGDEIFNGLDIISPQSVGIWGIRVIGGNLVFTNTLCNDNPISFTCSGITTLGITIPNAGNNFVKADGTVDNSTYISTEQDPIFNLWFNNGTFQVYWDQLIGVPESIGGEYALTTQDYINIKTIEDRFASFNCSGLLHNSLDGLQGGIDPDEYYHLSEAEHIFLQDLVLNGSGVLTLHSELSDVQNNYTHSIIDNHIDDNTIHFTKAEMNVAEIDPIFTGERNSLTQNYLVSKGSTTLESSDILVDTTNPSKTIYTFPGAIYSGVNSNIFIGNNAGETLNLSLQGTVGSIFLGKYAGSTNETGYLNIFIGNGAGDSLFDGVSDNSFSNTSTYIGANTRAGENNSENETVLGYYAIGKGSNTMVFGNQFITDNYFTGNTHTDSISFTDQTSIISSDLFGNMIFSDSNVTQVTLTDLLSGGNNSFQYWNITRGQTNSLRVEDKDSVSFNGTTGNIAVNLEVDNYINVNIDLVNTGVSPGLYTNPDLVVDEKGRITAIASNTSGCEQAIADMGTRNGTLQFDLDTYSGAIVTLDGNFNIQFTNVMEGDTGFIEVTHTGIQILNFTAPTGWSVKIANNNRQAAGQVLLSNTSATDIIAYWFAKNKAHLVVVYDSK